MWCPGVFKGICAGQHHRREGWCKSSPAEHPWHSTTAPCDGRSACGVCGGAQEETETTRSEDAPGGVGAAVPIATLVVAGMQASPVWPCAARGCGSDHISAGAPVPGSG